MLIVSIIIVQIAIFVGLIYFFRSILTKNVASATRHIDELNQEYSKREKEANTKLEEAKAKAKDIVHKAAQDAQAKREEIVKQTEAERGEILKQAREQSDGIMKQADKSRTALIREIDDRISKAAIKKAAELVQSALPDEIKQAAHAQWINDLIQNGFENIGKVKVAEGVKEIKVITAFPLKEGDRAKILKKVNGLLNKEMKLKEELDSKIVAGIVVEIGNLVLDGSLRNKILEHTAALDSAEKGPDEG